MHKRETKTKKQKQTENKNKNKTKKTCYALQFLRTRSSRPIPGKSETFVDFREKISIFISVYDAIKKNTNKNIRVELLEAAITISY